MRSCGIFERLGFVSSARKNAFGERAGMATDAQIYRIRQLWIAWTDGQGDDRSLGRWLRRTFKVKAMTARKAAAHDATPPTRPPT